ncbi:MAG: ThuA domain-containing protein [Verrucomicrobiota bacterium]
MVFPRPLLIFLLGVNLSLGAEKPEFLFLVGEYEYGTRESLPEFAEKNLKPKGYKTKFVFAESDDRADAGCHEFPGLKKALDGADVLVISTRRRFPPKEEMAMIREWIADGKPVVGIRTASHAFAAREKGKGYTTPEGHESWQNIDTEFFGAKYEGHFPGSTDAETFVRVSEGSENHVLLKGTKWKKPKKVKTSLYKNRELVADADVVLEGFVASGESEPLAWTRERDEQRIFYTSLGGVDDFNEEWFQRVMLNALEWAAGMNAPGKRPALEKR